MSALTPKADIVDYSAKWGIELGLDSHAILSRSSVTLHYLPSKLTPFGPLYLPV